jgi:hypothetical protein
MRLVYLLFICIGLRAQDLGDLSAERPGFTTSGGVVGFRVLQMENGSTLESARQGATKLRTFSAPSAVDRLGITKTLELRFSTDGYSWQSLRSGAARSSVSGSNDFVVGAKLRIVAQGKKHPDVSITGGLSLPARGSAFTSSGHDPSFTLAAYKDLTNKISVAGNANFASVTDAAGRIFSAGQSLWAERNMGGVSLFADVFHTTIGRLEGSEVAMDCGIFRGLGKNAQVDLGIGHTLEGARPAWFITMGFVFRDPHGLSISRWPASR